MNKTVARMYVTPGMTEMMWLGRAQSYRDAARVAQDYGNATLAKFYRDRMRFWSTSMTKALK